MISDHDCLAAAAEHAEWDARGMTLIPGNEISAGGPHLVHVNASRQIAPDMPRQRVLGAAAADDPGSFIVAAHPNWQKAFDHTPIAMLREWVGYAGLEIYNGVIGRLEGSPYATNKWDILLAEGRRLWGFAHDDSHREGEVGLGWNVAWVAERSAAAIVDALRRGRFYASTGVTIERIEVEGMTIRLASPDAERITALGRYGRRLAVADAGELELDLDLAPGEPHVRFELWGPGESRAWTQPFFTS
jgi:hypothetical protein